MKILVKLTLTCVLTLVPTTIRAADKPAAVIYFSSFDKVLQRVREVLGAMGTPQVVQQMDLVMRGVMQGGKSLPGIDNWRSFGAYVEEAAVDPHFVVFVPVSDSKKLLSFLSSMVTLEPRGRTGRKFDNQLAGQRLRTSRFPTIRRQRSHGPGHDQRDAGCGGKYCHGVRKGTQNQRGAPHGERG